MKRLVKLLLPILMLASIGLILTLVEARRPAAWESPLSQYLSGNLLPAGSRIQDVKQASQPWAFTAEMGQVMVNDSPWASDLVPLPPDEVWCIRLAHDDQINSTIIFITHYSDKLWRDGWLVFQGETPEAITIEETAKVGCQF